MSKYEVLVHHIQEYYFEIEAENKENAEDLAWLQVPTHRIPDDIYVEVVSMQEIE